jgi:hypothetical protein
MGVDVLVCSRVRGGGVGRYKLGVLDGREDGN